MHRRTRDACLGGDRLTRTAAAGFAGAAAGLGMSMAMMAAMAVAGRSLWTMPNLIAAMWLGDHVATGQLTFATAVGFLTHMATSIVMGLVAIPFIRELPRGRTFLASLSYGLASYPVVFAGVLSWANPLMVQRADPLLMTVGHALFGLVMGWAYLALRRRRVAASRLPKSNRAAPVR